MQNREGPIMRHMVPWEHRRMAFEACGATRDVTMAAIEGALQARAAWAALSLADRCAVFLKAADLLSAKYRYRVIAATVVGQGKNAWQAEIDAAAELCDFWRFNCQYAMQLVTELQPTREPSPGVWNWIDYRPLEGFVYAITPFNFTAIGGNLASAPALMGNVVLWKPSESAVLSNYLVYQVPSVIPPQSLGQSCRYWWRPDCPRASSSSSRAMPRKSPTSSWAMRNWPAFTTLGALSSSRNYGARSA
jgi:1-pyrroline-5-carboxylate dehydrogenase